MPVAIPIIRSAISGTLITVDHDHSRVRHTALHTEEPRQTLLRSWGEVQLSGSGSSALTGKVRASAEARQ